MYLCMPCLSFYFSQTFNRGPGAKLSAKTWGALKQDTSLRLNSFHPWRQIWIPRPSRAPPPPGDLETDEEQHPFRSDVRQREGSPALKRSSDE
ncbi:hypothetical protein CTAM01_09174 [Colletotrichum tamarilloi]|uniref:Uncharacterized protein n=1 Tax=Colletotrichum tamarilloi TaxID=1209934 RepID=A0ABQ9R4F4_9PEZI|nr:uncharacterized protein CTAM01_09174 [Colletotrichum tamarilloi]KAK1493983.1 hypothetical protein CTAM01_09174 [Colletotrichum tamarilloi]